MIKSTLLRGVFLLLPLTVVILIIIKILNFFHGIIQPITQELFQDKLGGVPVPRLLAILLLLIVCYLAGLVSRLRFVRKSVSWIETSVLSNLPGYTFLKNMAEDISGLNKDQNYLVVLVKVDEYWQIGFQTEVIDENFVAVYMPSSPSASSGEVYYISKDRVTVLNLSPTQAIKLLKLRGVGVSHHLKKAFENQKKPISPK